MRVFLLLASFTIYMWANAHILLYHRFGDDRHPSTNTTKEQLRLQFEYLKKNNYKVVSLKKIVNKIHKKEKIPDNWIALTIDDSFKSFLDNGLDIFKEYNYHFTMFVYVKASKENYGDFMNWDELKEITKYGDLELHSYGHFHMADISEEKVLKDTKKAIHEFKLNLNQTPTMFAYPYGEYNQNVQNTLKDFGFKAVLNQNNGSVNEFSNPLDINRIALVGKGNLKEKLKYKTLDVKWIEPQEFPKDGMLKKIKAKLDPSIKSAKLYVSGHGWRDIKVNNGIIDADLNFKLKNGRTRVIIGSSFHTISSKILTNY